MTRPIAVALLVLMSLMVGLAGYAIEGHSDALEDSRWLARRANTIERIGRGADSLGPNRAAMLLAVEDPGTFYRDGVDLDAAASGHAHLMRSLAERLGFDKYRGGVETLRLDGYARGLAERLSKRQALTLWIETVDMGEGPQGRMRGMLAASLAIYHRRPSQLSDREFLRLAAVAVAPSRYRLQGQDRALDERVERIERLVSRNCRSISDDDIWLEGCAAA